MLPGSEVKYFIARIRGGDAAAVGSIPEGAPAAAMELLRLGRRARRERGQATPAKGLHQRRMDATANSAVSATSPRDTQQASLPSGRAPIRQWVNRSG